MVVGLWASVAHPAQAFEFLGIRFGGEDEEEDLAAGIIDPRPYTVTFDIGPGPDGLQSVLRDASSVWSDRERPASGAAGLITAAQGDYRSLLATLYSEAHYGGAISIRINGREAASLSPADRLADPLRVEISVDPGPVYTFRETGYENAPPRPPRYDRDDADQRARERFRRGRPARADVINDAGDWSVEDWREAGHPVARVGEREVVANHERNDVSVTIRLDPGPQARFGEVTVQGTERVDPGFVRYMAAIPTGRVYTPEAIEDGERRLNDLGVFRGARITEAEELAPDGSLPVTIETIPRLPRRFGFGATLSTTEGLGLEGYWLHRNVLGRAERLRFDAAISGIGAEDDFQDYDYSFGVTFTKPGVFDPDIALETGVLVEQNVFEDYTERAASARAGFNRRFNERFSGSIFGEVSYSEVEDDTGTREFLTFSLPTSIVYDARNDELNATRGYYVSATVEPFHELEFQTTAVRSEVEGRFYWEAIPQSTVVALRGAYGTVFGGSLDEISPDKLFFTGGGGSIRGYPYRSNGLEIGGDTLGGRSKIEGSVELRQRLFGRYGAVAFLDGGIVSADYLPDGNSDLRLGAGIGARIYTGIGPIRVDVATPIDPRPEDPDVTFYVGIGQAF